jgi:transposase
MTILTRQERERLVIDLYNQGKTIREITKEVRMSFRDIGVILNKIFAEKAEGLKEQHEEYNSYLYLVKHTNSFLKVRLH